MAALFRWIPGIYANCLGQSIYFPQLFIYWITLHMCVHASSVIATCSPIFAWFKNITTVHKYVVQIIRTNISGGGPRVVVSTAAFHARVRGSVPGLGGFKETKMFLPHPRVKVSIVGSLRDREVACSASDRQGSNFESCVWRTVSSQSSHHPQEVLLAQFSLYVHKGGLKPDSFHFIEPTYHLSFLLVNLNKMLFKLEHLECQVILLSLYLDTGHVKACACHFWAPRLANTNCTAPHNRLKISKVTAVPHRLCLMITTNTYSGTQAYKFHHSIM